jgi:serine/threonine-protein kinase
VPAAPESTRFAIDLPAEHILTRAGRHVVALSPDGLQLVYVANRQLFLRSFRELEAKAIDGTANTDPAEPVFSPDGQWIAFWSNGALRKVPAAGGTAVSLGAIRNPYGLSWSGDRILIAVDTPRAIVEVPANGGTLKTLITVDQAKDEWVQSPQLVADGKAVLFTLRTGTGSWGDASIVVQDLASSERTVLVEGGTDGRSLRSGHLMYSREDTLYAVPFDEPRRAVIGAAVPVQQGVLQSLGGFTGASQIAVADSGTVAFVVDDAAGAARTLFWMTRDGRLQPTNLPARPYWVGSYSLAVSPDGKRVAARVMGASRAQSDIWMWEIARNTVTRLSTSGNATDPVWSPDGTRVCYESADSVWCQSPDGSGAPQALVAHPSISTIAGMSPDGASMLLNINSARGADFDISIAAAAAPFDLRPLIATPASDQGAAVSPDGRWIAYTSEESGVDEVYVRPFPGSDRARWQISTAGGVVPRWSRDGRQLYYLAPRSAGASLAMTITAVPVPPGNEFITGPPVVIASLPDGARGGYAVAPDGRFLVTAPAEAVIPGGGPRQRLVVVQNWFQELQSRVPTTPR